MPSHGGATTRRARFLWIRAKYLAREHKHQRRNWKWKKKPGTEDYIRDGRKWEHVKGPPVGVRCKIALSYNAGPILPIATFFPFTVAPAAYRVPPFVTITGFAYLATLALGHHFTFAVNGYYRRQVQSRRKRPRDQRNTAFNRRITGCNWYVFRNGYFPDDDPLSRSPSESEGALGAPPYPLPWPVPLGYT